MQLSYSLAVEALMAALLVTQAVAAPMPKAHHIRGLEPFVYSGGTRTCSRGVCKTTHYGPNTYTPKNKREVVEEDAGLEPRGGERGGHSREVQLCVGGVCKKTLWDPSVPHKPLMKVPSRRDLERRNKTPPKTRPKSAYDTHIGGTKSPKPAHVTLPKKGPPAGVATNPNPIKPIVNPTKPRPAKPNGAKKREVVDEEAVVEEAGASP